ncbi:MAG: FAD-dependent oxidoreductase [Candidatus Bathyarchaeota archaeon]|nr:FAD-dependent oxidoreductase [Candidatus Bathyarchaeota archaeon]
MPLRFDVDVLVVGGGMAGVAAAIASARNGMNTLLIEGQSSLGGLATNGLVSGIVDADGGICKEFLDKMKNLDALYPPAQIDPEKAKYVLEQMVLEAGAKILYGTVAIDATVEGNTIKEVLCYCKSGKLPISARIVIDTSGDADVAAYAGVPYEVGGREYAGLNESTTLCFRLSNVNMRKYNEAVRAWRAKGPSTKMSLLTELMEEAIQKGDLPYFIFPVALMYPVPGTPEEDMDVTVTSAHSFYCRCLDVEDLTRQILEQRQQIMWLEKFYRKYVPGFERCRITAFANLLGVRDSRRIIGEYVLTSEDVVCAKKFEDGIARFGSFLNTHHPTNPRLGFKRHVHLSEPKEPALCRPAQCSSDMHPIGRPGGYEARVRPGEYCEIPYRCLVPLKIDNLLVAGRCISTDFDAIAVRIIGPCMSMGQAAGTAAALCVKNGATPRKLDGKLVRKTMIEQGVPLDKEPDPYYFRWRAIINELKAKGEIQYIIVPGDFATAVPADGPKV